MRLLPAVSCVNQLAGRQVLTEISSGLILRAITDFHDKEVQGDRRHPRWHAYDKLGSIRYNALIAGVKGLGEIYWEYQ